MRQGNLATEKIRSGQRERLGYQSRGGRGVSGVEDTRPRFVRRGKGIFRKAFNERVGPYDETTKMRKMGRERMGRKCKTNHGGGGPSGKVLEDVVVHGGICDDKWYAVVSVMTSGTT